MTDDKKPDCDEKNCFFKEGEKYRHVCLYCLRNKNAEKKEDDYHTALQRNGY